MKSRRPEAGEEGDACGFARLLGMEVNGIAGGCVRVAMQADGMRTPTARSTEARYLPSLITLSASLRTWRAWTR